MCRSGTSMFVAGWLCVVLPAVVSSAEIIIYKKVGDTVVLEPGEIQKPITSIEWKVGGNLAAHLEGGQVEYFRHFKVRGSLNTSTGELTITGLMQNDSSVYTADIAKNSINLKVLLPVPEPTVTERCDEQKTSCTLTCDGDTTGAEVVTYLWRSDDVTGSSTKEHLITKNGSLGIKEFSCELQNPVSEERSKPFLNPFTYIDSAPSGTEFFGGKVNISSGLTVFICLLVAVLLLVTVHRWKAGMWFFQKASMPWEGDFWRKSPRDAAESNGTTAQEREQASAEGIPMTYDGPVSRGNTDDI